LRRLVGANPSLVDAGVFPELARDLDRVDAGLLPLGALAMRCLLALSTLGASAPPPRSSPYLVIEPS